MTIGGATAPVLAVQLGAPCTAGDASAADNAAEDAAERAAERVGWRGTQQGRQVVGGFSEG